LEQLSVGFLFRWFKNISNDIINEGTGATVQGVKLTFVNSLKIPLPKLETISSLLSAIITMPPRMLFAIYSFLILLDYLFFADRWLALICKMII
jgi:hypothetical protein